MLTVKNVKKSYNGREVLKDISLTLNDGEVYGLIGANGAGKTTLMNIITKIIDCEQGEVFINETKINRSEDLRGKIGYILDIPALFDYMTAHEYFDYLASITGVTKEKSNKRGEKLLQLVGLKDVGQKRLKSYSRGMRQRFGIAVGLYSNPDIIIMDEPTSALDPIGRYEIGEIIKVLKENNKTVMLSTHILSDVEKICDRVGILVNGVIKTEGTLHDVLKKYSTRYYEITPESDKEKLYAYLQELPYVSRIKQEKEFIKLEISEGDEFKIKLFQDVSSAGIPISSIINTKSSLEKIFLEEAN